jgi:hypothetical protein
MLECMREERVMAKERELFRGIQFRFDRMDFRITSGVKSDKVCRFANAVKSERKIWASESMISNDGITFTRKAMTLNQHIIRVIDIESTLKSSAQSH